MARVLEIRRAELQDIPAISIIENSTSDTPWSAESLAADIMENDRAYMAAAVVIGDDQDDQERVGYADVWMVAGEAQLNNIAVIEDYRGMGIGEAMLDHMMRKSTEGGCTSMTLEVRRSNEAAIGLYTKMGFRETGVRRGYYMNNNEDAILMERELV